MTDDARISDNAAVPPPPPPEQSGTPQGAYQQPAALGPQGPQKKGMGPLAWIGIGCGVLVLVVLIGMVGLGLFARHKLKQAGISGELLKKNPAEAAARIWVASNPDVELVKIDEDAGTMTIRNKKSGKVLTVDMEDVKNGKISIRDEETGEEIRINAQEKGGGSGSVTISNEKGKEVFQSGEGAAKNVPDWAPLYPGASTKGHFSMSSGDEKMVTLSLKTADPVDKVLQYYEAKLKAEGFSTSVTTQSGDKGKAGFVIGTDEKTGRSLQVAVSEEDGATSIGLSCTEKIAK